MRDVSRIWGLDPQFLGQRSAKPGLLRSDSQCGISDSGIGVYVRVQGKGMGITATHLSFEDDAKKAKPGGRGQLKSTVEIYTKAINVHVYLHKDSA